MSNLFYEPGSRRAARVKDLFAAVAARYDLLNDVQSFGLHRLWKRRLVGLARIREGDPALDVCCGTGDIAFRLAAAGAETTALDFSAPMLEIARERGLKRRCSGAQAASAKRGRRPATSQIPSGTVRFVQGDAQQLPFPDHSFAVVTMGYGLRNLADPKEGLREMIRVLQPAGRLLVLDFGKPPNRVLRALYFGYLRLMVPLFGRVLCGNAEAYAYILESLRHYPAQEGVADSMCRHGLQQVRIHNLLGGVMSINYGEKP